MEQFFWIHVARLKLKRNEPLEARKILRQGLHVSHSFHNLWGELLRVELKILDDGVDDSASTDKILKIYRESVDYCSSFELRITILEIFRSNEDLLEVAVMDMRRDINKDPSILNWNARSYLPDMQKAVEVFEQGLESTPYSSTKYRLFADLLREDIGLVTGNKDVVLKEDYIEKLRELYRNVRNDGNRADVSQLARDHVALLLRLDYKEEAGITARKWCGVLRDDLDMWLFRLLLEKTSTPLVNELLEVLSRRVSQTRELWIQAIDFLRGPIEQFDSLTHAFEQSVATSTEFDDDESTVGSKIVEVAHVDHGIVKARLVYNRFFNTTQTDVEFCRRCINLEMNLLQEGGEGCCLETARSLIHFGLTRYPNDALVTLWHHRMEKEFGNDQRS